MWRSGSTGDMTSYIVNFTDLTFPEFNIMNFSLSGIFRFVCRLPRHRATAHDHCLTGQRVLVRKDSLSFQQLFVMGMDTPTNIGRETTNLEKYINLHPFYKINPTVIIINH